MSDHDPIDRLLDEAFRSRSVPLDASPSLMDVRRRARRRHHRRTGATLGAVALVGVGGAVALAVRHDGRDQLAAGESDLGTPTTITCGSVLGVATTMPAATLPPGATTTLPPIGMYVILEGDTLLGVAEKFGVTVEQLELWNADRPEFAAFAVGTAIVVGGTTEWMPLTPTTVPGWYDPCAPGGWTWHCTGPMGTDEFGRDVFESCEQVNDGSFATTTVTILLPGSTVLEPEVTTSVNGNVDQTTTTSTIAIFEPTTSSVGG
ncbi:MAG: hypothetical protein RL238_426 [Actinomycetota bacterium]|jgi:hypothetical protein